MRKERVMTSQRIIAVIFLITMLTAGCHSSSPTALSDPYAGVWSGPITDDMSGGGTLRFVLSAQPAGAVIGTWTATFSNPANNNGGSVSTTVALGPPLQFGLECTQAGGAGAAIVTMTLAGNRLTGTYAGITCSGLTRGTAELTKQ